MRVALVSEHANPLAVLGGPDAGGQNVHVASLAAELAGRGVEVTVYTRRDAPTVPRRVEMCSGAVVEHLPAGPPQPVPKDELLPYIDELAVELHECWRRSPPDLVHAHFWMSGRASLAAARPLGLPVAQTFHALGSVKRRHHSVADTSPASRIDQEKMIVGAADRIIATCRDEMVELRRLGADPRRVAVVPCGVDLSLFRPDGPRCRPAGRRRLAVVGRLVERKGVADAIAALAEVPGAELVVAGGPAAGELDADPEYRRLRALGEDHGVADRLRFVGRLSRPQVASLLRSVDLVVTVPWYEPFGIVPLEAMASGTPVVASAVGGLTDSVVDGVTGLHVAPRRPDELASAVRALLGDDRRRERMAAAGLRRARSAYGWATVAGRTLDVYHRLLADHEGTAPAPRRPLGIPA